MAEINANWTFERVMEEQEKSGDEGPSSPLFQWSALQDLKHLEERFEAGDQFALMLALRKCAKHDLVMPGWVWKAYISAFDKVLAHKARSWDEVFGNPVPKGKQLQSLKRRRELGPRVHRRVREIRQDGSWYEQDSKGGWVMNSPTPIDEALFERVGEEFGIGKTLTAELYYEWQSILRMD